MSSNLFLSVLCDERKCNVVMSYILCTTVMPLQTLDESDCTFVSEVMAGSVRFEKLIKVNQSVKIWYHMGS